MTLSKSAIVQDHSQFPPPLSLTHALPQRAYLYYSLLFSRFFMWKIPKRFSFLHQICLHSKLTCSVMTPCTLAKTYQLLDQSTFSHISKDLIMLSIAVRPPIISHMHFVQPPHHIHISIELEKSWISNSNKSPIIFSLKIWECISHLHKLSGKSYCPKSRI